MRLEMLYILYPNQIKILRITIDGSLILVANSPSPHFGKNSEHNTQRYLGIKLFGSLATYLNVA
jgi:hypothetical protein